MRGRGSRRKRERERLRERVGLGGIRSKEGVERRYA